MRIFQIPNTTDFSNLADFARVGKVGSRVGYAYPAYPLATWLNFPVRFSGQAIENRARNTNIVLTFNHQYFRLGATFLFSKIYLIAITPFYQKQITSQFRGNLDDW